MSEPPVPSVLAVLVCEKIITEAGTHNKTLVNVFDSIQAPQFPAFHGAFWIYARMVDAEGDYVFRVELIHLETNKQIMNAGGIDVRIPSRLAAHDLALCIQMVSFELPGTYEMLIYANDVWIGRTTVSVVQRG